MLTVRAFDRPSHSRSDKGRCERTARKHTASVVPYASPSAAAKRERFPPKPSSSSSSSSAPLAPALCPSEQRVGLRVCAFKGCGSPDLEEYDGQFVCRACGVVQKSSAVLASGYAGVSSADLDYGAVEEGALRRAAPAPASMVRFMDQYKMKLEVLPAVLTPEELVDGRNVYGAVLGALDKACRSILLSGALTATILAQCRRVFVALARRIQKRHQRAQDDAERVRRATGGVVARPRSVRFPYKKKLQNVAVLIAYSECILSRHYVSRDHLATVMGCGEHEHRMPARVLRNTYTLVRSLVPRLRLFRVVDKVRALLDWLFASGVFRLRFALPARIQRAETDAEKAHAAAAERREFNRRVDRLFAAVQSQCESGCPAPKRKLVLQEMRRCGGRLSVQMSAATAYVIFRHTYVTEGNVSMVGAMRAVGVSSSPGDPFRRFVRVFEPYARYVFTASAVGDS